MPVAVALVVLLTAMNLRGVRESGKLFAIPTYAFMVGVVGMSAYGYYRAATGDLPLAESAKFELGPGHGMEGLAGFAMVFLLLRAFSSGCAALTGVEAISNGVPAYQKPKSKNAATTLRRMGTIAVTMLMSIIFLANKIQLKFAEFPAEQLVLNGVPVGEGYVQETVLGQLASTVFDTFPLGLYFICLLYTSRCV